MTPDYLNKIKERLAKATPGPWVIDHSYTERITDIRSIDEDGPVVLEADIGRVRDDDAVFIAHAPEDIAALVEEIENLQDEVASNRAGWAGSRTLNQKYKAALEKIARYKNQPDKHWSDEIDILKLIAQEALK